MIEWGGVVRVDDGYSDHGVCVTVGTDVLLGGNGDNKHGDSGTICGRGCGSVAVRGVWGWRGYARAYL